MDRKPGGARRRRRHARHPRQKTTFDLPGRLEAFTQALLYARVGGYLKEWKTDIGTPVKTDELLAEIDAPDLDQQIMQAQAALASAQANSTLAGRDAAARAAADPVRRGVETGPRPKGRRRRQQGRPWCDRHRPISTACAFWKKYKRITAPFRRLVTARNTDVGMLINAAGGGAPLFVVRTQASFASTSNVPQNYVPNIRLGTKAQVTGSGISGRKFSATVEASSQAVDVASGTTRMLLVVDNASGEFDDGSLRQCELRTAAPGSRGQRAGERVIFDRSGLRVATRRHNNRVVLKRSRSRAISARWSKSDLASPPTTASSKARRTASPQAIRFRVAGAPGTPPSPRPHRPSSRPSNCRDGRKPRTGCPTTVFADVQSPRNRQNTNATATINTTPAAIIKISRAS